MWSSYRVMAIAKSGVGVFFSMWVARQVKSLAKARYPELCDRRVRALSIAAGCYCQFVIVSSSLSKAADHQNRFVYSRALSAQQ